MEEENNEYLKLPIEDRCIHKLWKARVSGYEEAAKLFQLQDDEKSSEFNKYLGLFKKMVADSNAVAQEKGLAAILAFLENAAVAPKTVNDILSTLITKCFASSRAKTKELAVAIVLMYIEIEKQEVVLEELIKGFENKSPKVQCACIAVVKEALCLFGNQVVSIKSVIKPLPKLLEDRDKGVREESKQLIVEIYRWVGSAIKNQFNALKPVALTDLEKEFEKVAGVKATPTRYLKSQQEKIAKIKESNPDVQAEEVEECAASVEVDPFDLMTEVNILSKLPSDFFEKCEAKKWQDRKEALDVLLQLTTNVKIEGGDYGDLVRTLKKFITKDANIVVASLAVKCLTNLVLGLRKKFQPYVSAMVPAVFEKFKEKKTNVVAALREAIDALVSISNLEGILEDVQAALENKNPQIRDETCSFLIRTFSTMPQVQLNKKLLKALTPSLLKTLNDTDGTVREHSAEALGMALKVVGERNMKPFLEGIEAIKMTKINDFSEKAIVSSKSVPAPGKKPSSAPPASKPAPKAEQPPKPVVTGIKKPASAGPVKKKTASVRPTATNKKATTEAKEVEFREPDLSEEDVMTQAAELMPPEAISGLSSSNWKDRLASVEKFSESVHQMEKGSIPAQCLIKLLAKKPGFKENNFQILKLRFEIVAYVVEHSKISHATVESCLSDIVDKIGDAKNGGGAAQVLTSFAGATSLEYISLEVLTIAFNQKNPKNQSEALIWVSNAIKQFGFKLQIKEVIDNMKKAFSSTNPAVRNAALALVGTMYMYIGKSLRSFFEDEKPALLQQIDAEFEKMKDAKPPAPEKAKDSKASDSEDPDGNSGGQVNLADLMPRVDISSQITTQLLSDLADKDWHLRSDALQKISTMISDAKYITPNLGDLPTALRPRLVDTNKRLGLQALSICQQLGEALGSHCSKQIRNFGPGILTCLGDNKANVRAAAVQCLNAWIEQCALASLFEGEIVYDVLKAENPFLRMELFSWLAERLPTVTSLPNAELNLCAPILLACVEDRNADVRKKASDCLLPFMTHVGYESMARAASKLKPASKATVIAQLDKARQSLPVKTNPNAKAKQTRTIPAPSSNDRLSPPNDESKGKLTRSTSKQKLSLKPPAPVSKSKKEDDVDTSPPLVENNMKDQRMQDEKALKVLRWNFTSPREEFYVQLKEQMITANWSKTLITNCFHNDFKFHLKSIDLLMESLMSNVEASASNLDLILKWLSLRFFDTNPSVLIKSLDYLQLLFQALMSINYRMLDAEAVSFVPYLILKIGDPKDGVRKGVREIIKSISRVLPYSKMFSYIMQGLGSKNARQRAECLEELGAMIETYGIGVCQPSPSAALKEIARQISDRDNSVRTAALNCVVQAFFIEGEKVYKYVGNLSDKDMGLLEERIKRSSKTKMSKTSDSSIMQTPKASQSMNSTFQLPMETETKATPARQFATPARPFVTPAKPPASANQSSGRLKLDDIEEMFRHKEPSIQVPDLVQVNADDILNLPDIQLPRTRLRPPATSLKLLNNSAEVDTAVNLVMAQLTAQDIPVVIQAMAQFEEVLRDPEQAVKVLGPRVDQLLVMGAMQYRYAHNKHMADENICKADVVALYRGVTMTLVTLFDNQALAKKASRDVLRDLIPHLITVMLDNRLDDLQEGAQVVKVINVLIIRVLMKSNPTNVLSALIKLLHDCVGSVNVSDRFTDLVMKCLWKMIRMIGHLIEELNIDRILLDIHVFLKAYPSQSWKDKSQDTPIRTIKTILFKLVEIKNGEIMKHLSLISDRQESDLVSYLNKLLSRKKDDNRRSINKTPDDNGVLNRQNKARSSPMKLSKSHHEALTEIFKKIGSKDQTKDGLNELFEFTQSHPEANIEPYLENSSDFFQNYIRQGLQQIQSEKGHQSPLMSSNKKIQEMNSNLMGKDITLVKEVSATQSWGGKFPPVPPATVDTTPMDLVDWLKNVVAVMGMDTSRFDDPAFLEKMTGTGNEGPMSEEEIQNMFSEIEKYKKIVENLKNAA